MKIKILFGQRVEAYDGEFAPEVLVAWDEFTYDENPYGFADAVEKIKSDRANEFVTFRVIDVEVDQDKIRRLLVSTPCVPGTVDLSNDT